MAATNREPYQQSYYPPVPNRFVKWTRKSLPYQFIRFWVINYKILRLLLKSGH